MIRPLLPSARGSSGEPGTANTSRPCSFAIRAVISEPAHRPPTDATPTASPEISRLRRGKSRARGSQFERHFRDRRARAEDRVEQVDVLGRIDARMAAGERRDRAGRNAGAVGAGVDPARQPRDDDEAGLAEVAREPLGEFLARRGRIAGADDAEHRPVERASFAAHGEQRRGVVDLAQPLRIVGLAERDVRNVELVRCGQLALGILRRADARTALRAAAAPAPAARQAPRARRRSG